MDGFLDPSKYNLQENKMTTEGINLDGFTASKVEAASTWPVESYTEAPAAAFPAADKSSQDGAGLGNGGK